MKKINISPFVFLSALVASSVHANPSIDRNWHTVLSCDDDAVVIDNRETLTVGRDQLPATTAQIVIRNPQIVQYFATALAMNNGNGDGYEIIDNQWISSPVPQVTYEAGAVITSFTTGGIYGSQAQMNYDGTGLSVQVASDNNQTANWYFHSCVRQ